MQMKHVAHVCAATIRSTDSRVVHLLTFIPMF